MRGVSNRRIIPYDRREDKRIEPVTLSLSNLTYANASPRYIWHNGILTGPFAAGIPATRWIGGRRYIQIEKAITQLAKYNTTFDAALWNTLMTKALVAPPLPLGSLGNVLKLTTTDIPPASNNNWRMFLNEITGVLSAACSLFMLKGTQGTATYYAYSESGLSGLIITPTTTWQRHCKVLGGIIGNIFRIYHDTDGDAGSDAVVGDNHYWMLPQIEEGEKYCHSPIINTTGAPLVKAKDEGYFATADVLSWMRNGFTLYAYPEFSLAELVADGGIRYLATLDTTAEVIEIYLDAGGNIVVVGSVSGLFVQASGLTWSAYQRLKISIEYNNGSNSVLTTSGFTTGNAATTGIAFSGAGGPVYLGMTKLLAGQWDGLLSEPEML